MNSSERENIISLLTCYREEWMYRDTDFANTFWRFAYLSLIIGFLPNLLENFKIHDAPLLNLPPWVFSIAGILFSILGLLICLNNLKRIEKLDDIYFKLIRMLPHSYRIEFIVQDEGNKKYHIRTNFLFCLIYVLIILLILINAFMKYMLALSPNQSFIQEL